MEWPAVTKVRNIIEAKGSSRKPALPTAARHGIVAKGLQELACKRQQRHEGAAQLHSLRQCIQGSCEIATVAHTSASSARHRGRISCAIDPNRQNSTALNTAAKTDLQFAHEELHVLRLFHRSTSSTHQRSHLQTQQRLSKSALQVPRRNCRTCPASTPPVCEVTRPVHTNAGQAGRPGQNSHCSFRSTT